MACFCSNDLISAANVWEGDGEGRLLWGFGGVFKGDGRLGSGGLP